MDHDGFQNLQQSWKYDVPPDITVGFFFCFFLFVQTLLLIYRITSWIQRQVFGKCYSITLFPFSIQFLTIFKNQQKARNSLLPILSRPFLHCGVRAYAHLERPYTVHLMLRSTLPSSMMSFDTLANYASPNPSRNQVSMQGWMCRVPNEGFQLRGQTGIKIQLYCTLQTMDSGP